MSKTFPYNQDLASLLSLSFSAMNQELHNRLKEAGFGDVRPAHSFLFQGLMPDGATAKTLVAHLGISKQAVSQMLDYLEECGYVARKPHPSDGRGKMVVLTERGWSLVRTKENIYKEIEQRWTRMIGSDHMKTLQQDLKHIIENVNEEDLQHPLRPVW
jgi:DNA-binding MarR family transcriptional regulator